MKRYSSVKSFVWTPPLSLDAFESLLQVLGITSRDERKDRLTKPIFSP